MATKSVGTGQITLNGTIIPFQQIEPSIDKTHEDSTDSTNYDTASGIVHKAQLAVSTQTTFDVSGVFDFSTVPNIVAMLYSNPGSVPCTIKYNSNTYGHGYVDISNFKTTIDPTKPVPYSMTLMTNGVFTPNS